jgi:ribosomal protein L12E/L44/L45/RPP1/RPP2
LNHVQNKLIKSDYLTQRKFNKNINNKSAFEKADIQSKINIYTKKQKYQTLLKKDKNIENLCSIKNKEIKSELDNRKIKLKNELTRIINDALLFSKKNNPVKSMLPNNINEIVENFKKQNKEVNVSLNITNLSKISNLGESKPKKNEFLSLLGVDLENLTVNHVNIDIDKAWDFVLKWSKGRNIEDILRLKVVNAIMGLTEKKASEKARSIYEKMEIYKKYLEQKENEEKKKKQKEEEEKYEYLRKNNPNELIKERMMKSLSQPKLFNKDEGKIKNKNLQNIQSLKNKIKKKKMHKSESATFTTDYKNIIRYNSYKDVNEIIKFINNSKKDSQSKICKPHFMNIKMTKNMDSNLQKMIDLNQIKFG